MQLSEKEKQALQEKIKEQRQAMWSGKQSTAPDTEEKAAEAEQDVNSSDSSEVISSDVQSDSSSMAENSAAASDGANEETSSSQPTPESESGSQTDAPAVSSMQNSSDAQDMAQSLDGTETSAQEFEAIPATEGSEAEEGEQAAEGERVFWETLEQEGGSSVLTWKIVLAVIGVALVLVGVGVYLGFLFAG